MRAAGKLKRESGTDAVFAALGADRMPVASPWQAQAEQNALWLQERGFHPRHLVEPAWTKEEEQMLSDAVEALAAGTLQKPTDDMRTAHFLSHHVMDCRHSQSSCMRKLYELRRRLGPSPLLAAVASVLDNLNDDIESDEDAGSGDSDDELVLPRPLGL